MAYMRGEFYVWGDGVNTHFNEFSMPDALVDAFCAMRWASMTDAEREAAEALAVEKYGGNFGCIALCEKRGVPSGLDMLEAMVAEHEASTKDRDVE